MSKHKDNLKNLRSLKESQLEKKLQDLKKKVQEISFQTYGDEVRNVHELKDIKKEIARILTVIKEK